MESGHDPALRPLLASAVFLTRCGEGDRPAGEIQGPRLPEAELAGAAKGS
jgi:hypothetical protein